MGLQLYRTGLDLDKMGSKANDIKPWVVFGLILVAVVSLHWWKWVGGEPFFNNDETRHVMTGVFFRDLFIDLPIGHLRDYVVNYYLQYPALGLLIWPPMFYVIEGMAMMAFGTSFLFAKILIVGFACLSLYYLFRLSLLTHGLLTASLATVFMAISPLFFQYSQLVMLEIPTLAFAMASLYHFNLFLEGGKKQDIIFSGMACAFAMLTRFDALFLLPTFLALVLLRKQPFILFRKEVLLTFFLCLLFISPFYAATAIEFGKSHMQAIGTGTAPGSTHFLALLNFIYYPKAVPEQMGWSLTLLLVIGALSFLLHFSRKNMRQWLPFFALALFTYVTFTPMAELGPRHTIYWVPALSVFATAPINLLFRLRLKFFGILLACLCLIATAYGTLRKEVPFLIGYEEAAKYVLDSTKTSPYCLFDNFLNGNLIYQIRRHDSKRRLSVLRGDKLFYAVMSEPHAAYKEFALGKEDILSGIYKYDPEYIVVEYPQVRFQMPMAGLLREVLEDSTDRFQRVWDIPLETNQNSFKGVSLLIYKNLIRNPHPTRLQGLEMVGLGHPILAPKSKY